LVQETLLRAWRAADRDDPARSSLRTWLCRLATNASLIALERRDRRPLPAGLVGPSDDPLAPMMPDLEVAWLQPFPSPAGETRLRLWRQRTIFVAPPARRALQ